MADERTIEYQINTTADTSGAQQQAAAIDKTTAATKALTDESARYEQWVAKQIAAKEAADAEKNTSAYKQLVKAKQEATAESERYQQTLQKMAESQGGGPRGVSAEDQAMIDRAAARKKMLGERADAMRFYDQDSMDPATAHAKSMEAVAQGAEEAGKKAEFLGLKMGEVKKLTHELGREFPVAGAAVRALMNPLVFGITTAIGLFVTAKERLAEWNAEMDAVAERNAQRDFLPGIESKLELLNQAKSAVAALEAGFKNINVQADAMIQKFQRALTVIHEQTGAQAGVRSAKEDKEMADIDLKVARGEMTPAAAIAAKARVRDKYQRQADEAATKSENDELRVKQAELDHAKGQQPGLEAEAKAQTAAVLKAKAELEQRKKDLESGKKNEADYADELSKAEEALNEGLKGRRSAMPGMGWYAYSPWEEARDRDAMESAKNRLEAQRGLNAKNKKAAEDLETTIIPAGEGLASRATAQANSNGGLIAELVKTLQDLKTVIGVRQTARAEAAGPRSAATFETAEAQIEAMLREGQKNEQRLFTAARAVRDSGGNVSQQMVDQMNDQARDNWRLSNQLHALEREQARVRDKIALRPPPP